MPCSEIAAIAIVPAFIVATSSGANAGMGGLCWLLQPQRLNSFHESAQMLIMDEHLYNIGNGAR
jgi:hypothetical protein